MRYFPAHFLHRRLYAAIAVAATAAVSAACASSPLPAARASAVVPPCTGNIGAWIAVSHGNEVSGRTDYPLEFTNLGTTSCALSGYPVVSAVSQAGAPLGSPAGRGRSLAAPQVVLAPGATAHTTLVYDGRLVGAGGSCGPAAVAARLRVNLAGSRSATYAAFGLRGCSHAGPVYLTVTQSIRAGVGPG